MQEFDGRKLSKELQVEFRKRGVRAVKIGKTKKEVAECFGVSRNVVTKWCKKEAKGGEEVLEEDKRGLPKGTKGKLKSSEKKELIEIIKNKLPDEMGLSAQLWTRKAIAKLIKNKYKVNYVLQTISKLLKGSNLTPQKPVYRATQRNEGVIKDWLVNVYPKIKERAKKEEADIHWGDEMGVRSTHVFGRSYGIKNKTPVVNKTTKRFGCNMISSITNKGLMRFMIFKSVFNADVFLKFLRRLIYRQKKKIFIILDNHKVHHCKKSVDWLEKYKEKIEVFFLPAYAPELNPDEMLNRNVKSNVTYSNLFASQNDLFSTLKSYLFSLQHNTSKIKSFFDFDEVSYASQ
jgi:transposase